MSMRGIALARQLEDAPRLEAVGRGDHEQARVLDPGRVEHAGRGGVAEIAVAPGACALARPSAGRCSITDELQALRRERMADDAADAAVADDAPRDSRRCRGAAHRQRRWLARAASFEQREQARTRVEPARQRRRRSRTRTGLSVIDSSAPARIRSRPSGGSKPERDAEAGEDERELADLRQARGNRQRGAHRIAEREHDRRTPPATCRP